MESRLRFAKLAPEGLAAMREVEKYLNTTTGLGPNLLGLVRLRSSLMNGCDFCVDLHTTEFGKVAETPEHVNSVADWRESALYSKRERAALAWAEAITNIQAGHAPDETYNELREHFNEADAVNLTMAISSINMWNRFLIGIGPFPGRKAAAEG